MLGLILATAVVLDSRTPTDPKILVDQLGSSRYALRMSAEGDLSRLGRKALTALREGKDSKDAEIRARSVALLARIEAALLLEATPVGLDFRDVPLPEAIAEINRISGLGLALAPEEGASLTGRKVNLRTADSLPFWKAIDTLCSAAGLHTGPGDAPATGVLDGALLLFDGFASNPAPISDSGPFRVRLESAHYQSQIQWGQTRATPATGRVGLPESSLASARPAPRANRELFLQLALAAEPRISITRNGPIKVISAIDDRGESLLSPDGLVNFQHTAGYFGLNPTSSLRLRIDLNPPASPIKQIRVLRGSIPVIVAMRRPDPMVMPLDGPTGRTFRGNEVALTLVDFKPAATGRPATVQVSIKPLGDLEEPVDHGKGEPLGYRPGSPQQQIELLDAEGRILPWFPSTTSYNGEETRITLTVGHRATSTVPTRLRYHGIIKANTDIPFEFRDVPIP